MKPLLALLLLAGPAVAQVCPPSPDLEPRKSQIFAAIQAAPDEMSARRMTDDLWSLWAKAPDQYAQELLDEGLDRRNAYDFGGAMAAFDALVEYCPNYAEGYNQRAFIGFMREDFDAALADLDRALALSPDHVAAMAGKALTLFSLNQLEESKAVLRQALKLHPWLPERGMFPDL